MFLQLCSRSWNLSKMRLVNLDISEGLAQLSFAVFTCQTWEVELQVFSIQASVWFEMRFERQIVLPSCMLGANLKVVTLFLVEFQLLNWSWVSRFCYCFRSLINKKRSENCTNKVIHETEVSSPTNLQSPETIVYLFEAWK